MASSRLSTRKVQPQASPLRIAMRIPGTWESPDALMLALPDEFDVDERGLIMEDGAIVELSAMPPDEEFSSIFTSSCDRPPSDDDHLKIQNATATVCLCGEGGTPAHARRMLDAAAAIVRAGGAGVFIDNSGLAHGSDDLLALAGDDHDGDAGGIFWAYVSTIGSRREVWSLGMHVFGHRDAIMPRSGDDAFDHLRLNDFLGYTFRSGAPVNDGDLVGGQGDAEFRLKHETIRDIPRTHAMFNPFGRWRLVPLAEA